MGLSEVPVKTKNSRNNYMNIPQAELDKLQGLSFGDDESTHEEEESKEEDNTPVEKEQGEVSSSTDEDVVADKARVPYSRFESVNERAIRAEERLKILEEEIVKSKTVEPSEIDVPTEWVELYGDSDEAKRAYQLQLKLNERMQEEASKNAYERIINREKEEKELVDKNLEEIENSIADFESTLGRKLTEKEESSILDIQDEFTAKDENGKYITSLFPPDKAFEIYELRSSKVRAAKTQAKNRVLGLTGASSEGDVSDTSAGYRPNVWGSWRDKI